ncbi:hypothetical protein FACS1894217_05960 [Clostridia bacterium]|nr:hypothetical protein FACS1894217_05960 [Clostridia bacterium]
MDENNKDRLHIPKGFEPVFLPEARDNQAAEPEMGERRSFTLSRVSAPPSFAERDNAEEQAARSPYARFGYQNELPAAARKKGHPLLFGGLIGAGIALFVLMFVFLAQGSGDLNPFPGLPTLPGMSAPPESTQTLVPSGGGDAELALNPRPKETLTTAQIADRNVAGVVCILVTDARGRGGSATGIIMTKSGYVITNHHVVNGAAKIDVVLEDGTRYSASLVGMDRATDLAVIKISAPGLAPAEFGDSDLMSVGEPVVVIGNPLGIELHGTVTNGIISAVNRDIEVDGRYMTVLQTNASVNPGNSGGPMINEYGQVIGVVSSKIMGSFTSSVEGLGFAIPITPAKPIIDALIRDGYVAGRVAIGITNSEVVDIETSRYYDVPVGIKVLGVNENSDIYKQGLRVNDIITAADGKEITTLEGLRDIRDTHKVGESMTIKVYREGETFDITFKLMDEGELQ